MRGNTAKIAVCGVVSALSVVMMMFEGLVQVASIAIPAIAGCLLIPIVAEAGAGWALGSYGATAALCMFIAPDREAALIYLLFFGYYPVLFAWLSKIRSPVLCWLAKLGIFNIAAALEAALTVYVLGIPWEDIPFLPMPWSLIALAVLANLVFVLYDKTLQGLIREYFRRLHGKLAGYFKN